jgi:hypothetical protein
MFERWKKKSVVEEQAKEVVIPVVPLSDITQVVHDQMCDVMKDILAVESTDLVEMIQTVKELLGPKEDISKVKRELANLKLDKDIQIRDIEHLVKCKEQQLELKFKKKELDLRDLFKNKEMDLQTEYHDKTLALLEKGREEQKAIHAEIMKRLPNVNMEMEVTSHRNKKP